MTNTDNTTTGSSPNGGTNMGSTSQQQSVPNTNQGNLQNGGAQQQSNAMQAGSFIHTGPAINTIYTKKSYNLDAVDILIGVSSQTGEWQGIKFEYWLRQLNEAFVTNNIDDEKEKIFLARSKIDSSNDNTIKAFIESCKPMSEANTFAEFKRLLSNVMIRGLATNFMDAFINFKSITWDKNMPIYGFFTKLTDAIEEYGMLMYSQAKEVVSERVKRSLILAQFLENCPKRWLNRLIEVANVDLNISDQIKVILDATKHELLINTWKNFEEGDQVAHVSKGKFNKKEQNKENSKDINKGRSMSRARESITCYNCFKKGHIKKECRSPAYCQACRQEHKPGSEECKNTWRYGQVSKDHKKNNNGNYGYQTQGNRDNSYQHGSTNHYYNGYRNQYRNHRGNYRGRGTHNQNYSSNYRHNNEESRRHEENFKTTSGNYNRVNTLNDKPEQQSVDNYEEAHYRSVKNDYEDHDINFR